MIIHHRFTDYTITQIELIPNLVIVLTPQAIRICGICESVVNLILLKSLLDEGQ
jgi:hypothetical protein